MSPNLGSNQTIEGYKYPSSTQFSVFLDNRVGKLLELVNTFDGHSLAIVALSVVDSTDHAVVRLVTNDAEQARKLLRQHGLAFSESNILLVNLAHNQALADLCRCLLAAEVNIHYAYPLILQPKGAAAIAIHTDDQVLACQILQRKRFTLLGEADIPKTPWPTDPLE